MILPVFTGCCGSRIFNAADIATGGDSTECVDVRVMEVEYELNNPSSIALLPGQIVDVFVEVPAESEPATETGAGSAAAAATPAAKVN